MLDKISQFFSWFMIIFMGIITGLLLYTKYVAKDAIPNILGLSVLKVVSGSMTPTIDINEYFVITPKEDYAIGDIVTYQDNYNNLVTHRIVRIENEEIITKGDANNTEDPPVSKARIIGKFAFSLQPLFNIVEFLINPIVLIWIFGCSTVFVFIYRMI